MPTREQGREAATRLVDSYRARIRELRGPATSEAVIRQEFLDPFWQALGWDVGNRAGKPAGEKDVLIEAGVGTIEDKRFRHRRFAYFFRVGGFPSFFAPALGPITGSAIAPRFKATGVCGLSVSRHLLCLGRATGPTDKQHNQESSPT
jgi:hypothetical protein